MLLQQTNIISNQFTFSGAAWKIKKDSNTSDLGAKEWCVHSAACGKNLGANLSLILNQFNHNYLRKESWLLIQLPRVQLTIQEVLLLRPKEEEKIGLK